MLNFTDTQKLACDISRNIAVTAGAGSGKTRVLVERYLWCLQNNNYQVRRLVAITFTEKAAGEMLARIRERIMDYISGDLGDTSRWEEVLEHLSLANISTIHGFCQRLLREFPIEAGVDPKFEVFDEAAKRISLTNLIDAIIQQRAQTGDANMIRLAKLWTPYGLRTVILHLIAFRGTSLPWAERILQEQFSDYFAHLKILFQDLQRQGILRIAADTHWQETVALIDTLIPEGDNSKLTSRCLNILDYDRQFRDQTREQDQLLTLKMLRKDLRMVTPSKSWKEDGRNTRLKEAFERLKTVYDSYLPPVELHEELEKSGFLLQQALADLLRAVYTAYQQEKTIRRVLDFDDLQEYALLLLEQPEIHAILSQRYDYIMVDEFQDTNHLQWTIIRKLGIINQRMAPHKFCVVGDEKQSIYMFRGADVAVFSEVRQELQQVNLSHQLQEAPLTLPPLGDLPEIHEEQKTGELIMAENFRSFPPLVFFFNYLFSRLFLPVFDSNRPYDVRHQELLPGRQMKEHVTPPSHPIEFLLVHSDEDDPDSGQHPEEPELVARRIRELTETHKYSDIAILLRTRTRLKEFEEALRHHKIPFVVAGGIGFYQQQEIYDLANLLRILVDHRQDIALAGVLRSPLFNFSDDQLLYLSVLPKGAEVGEAMRTHSPTLWEKLAYHARLSRGIPPELHPPQFSHAHQLLHSWKARVNRIPISSILRRILEDTGFAGILAASRRDVQSLINIEKLLDIARTFENNGFQTLSDFVTYLDLLIELEEREGEAQLNFEGIEAVRLMTIHAAKGLEFPVVFVPELDRTFNYGLSEPVYLDTIDWNGEKQEVAGVKGLHPEQNYDPADTFLRALLKQINKEKTDAEMKRLLYVACTRAEEQLILSGTVLNAAPKNSWMKWLMRIFPLSEALAQRSLTLSDDSIQPDEIAELLIPIRTSSDYLTPETTTRQEPTAERLSGPLLSHPFEIHDSPSALDVSSEVYTMLRENLTPLGGPGNEIFRISPSTAHLLFQCPRKYYYQEILHLPESNSTEGTTPLDELSSLPISPLPEGSDEHYGRLRGTLIHRLFEEQVFDRAHNEQALLSAVDTLFGHLQISKQMRQAMRIDALVVRTLQHYQQSGLRELLARSSQVHREYPFRLRVGRADISGTLDVLFFDPDRQIWTILDYKSNEIASEQIPEEIGRHGYGLQMQLYALAVSRLFQVADVRSILFFTFPGSLYDAIDLSPEALEQVTETLSSSLDRLAEGVTENAHDPQICEECGYKGYGVCLAGSELCR